MKLLIEGNPIAPWRCKSCNFWFENTGIASFKIPSAKWNVASYLTIIIKWTIWPHKDSKVVIRKNAPKGTTTTTLNFKYINIITPIWPCLIILFSVELFNAAIQCSQDTLIFYSFPPWPGRLPLNCKKIENKIFSCVLKGFKKPHSVFGTFLKDSSFNFTYELQVWIKCAYMCIYEIFEIY